MSHRDAKVPRSHGDPRPQNAVSRRPARSGLGAEHHFRILGVDVTLSGPEAVIGPITYAFRRFAVDGCSETAAEHVVVALADSGLLTVNDRALPLVPDLAPGIQLYHRLQAALMDAVGSWAVLHAAAVADDRGGAIVLAGPSGHGKSSLALELAKRGHGFLSDDIAPLDLVQSLVSPFHRAVAVVPDANSPIPEPFLSEARRPSAVRWLGKSLIDVGQTLGEAVLVDRPLPLRHVFLLTSGEDGRPVATVVELTARAEDSAELNALFESTPGVEILERRSGERSCTWRIRLDHETQPTRRLSELFDSDRILLFDKHWEAPPDFAATPEAKAVRRRDAAETLAREMLNRRSSGRLLASYGGSVTRIFFDLAGALRDARCWRVRVGGIRETADLIDRTIEGTDQSDGRPREVA
jgi:hypothetical protein